MGLFSFSTPHNLASVGALRAQITTQPSRCSPAAILCTGGPDAIRKEAWPFHRTSSGFDTTMGLVEADLDPGVWVSMETIGIPSHTPLEDHPLDTHCEPSALYCWILQFLYCDPKGRRALLRVPSTEGRSVCPCWAKSKSKGPKGVRLCWELEEPKGPKGKLPKGSTTPGPSNLNQK